jgi:hypothetical protein
MGLCPTPSSEKLQKKCPRGENMTKYLAILEGDTMIVRNQNGELVLTLKPIDKLKALLKGKMAWAVLDVDFTLEKEEASYDESDFYSQ